MKKQLFIHILFTLLFFFGYLQPVQAGDDDYYVRLKKSWNYMQRVYEQLSLHYVEEIDPYPLIKSGIEGMLGELDPYTVFIEEEGEDRVRMITTGKYGGLGMEIGLNNGKVTVISPIDDTPAKRAGIQAGDIIEKIDGQDVRALSINEVSRRLRGKVGTKISLLIRRPGLKDAFELHLTRAEIVIRDVGYAGFLKPGIAYVSLTGFTEKAASELTSAIQSLQEQGEIHSFILDLRANPGGLLESAVDVSNVFIPKDEVVVSTRGFREEQHEFRTNYAPLLPDIPLVVLVDGGSASASEIVAGAFQDLDRAVIVGEPTFGKGLVQKIFTIDQKQDARIKITTAKYYVPSGRCIQRKDYGFENHVILRDSLDNGENGAEEFFTRNERRVYDKGGIYPDIPVKRDSVNFVLVELLRKGMLFDFAVHYHQANENWTPETDMAADVLPAFNEFLREKEFSFEAEGLQELKRLEKVAQSKNYSQKIFQLMDKTREALELEKQKEFEKSLPMISQFLKLELAEIYFGKKERDRIALNYDQQVNEAARILLDQSRYKDILDFK